MSHLLLKMVANPTMNRTIFPAHLYLYSDVMIYRKRSLLKIREISIAYSHISQVNLIRGIFFAGLEVHFHGESVEIKYVPKAFAKKAKKIIDQKVYFEHAKEKPDDDISSTNVHNFEKSLKRLKELRSKGMISEKEFNSRKQKYLKRME